MLDPKDLFQPKTSIILTGLMTKHVEAYMSKAKRIFIVGQSGAGKGVVAEEVAKQLGWKFINADVLASVASIGRSVTDVFGAGSEDKFNQTLTEILQHQITQENIVVTTDENVWQAQWTWDNVKRFKDKWDIPLILKGIIRCYWD